MRARMGFLALSLLLMGGCETGLPSPPRPADAQRAAVLTTGGLSGRVVDETGSPIADATIAVLAFSSQQRARGTSTTSDTNGDFTLSGASDRNLLLSVSASGHYGAQVPVDLQDGQTEARALGDIVLVAKQANRARLILCGDTMFGRRFADKDEDGIEGEADDLIRPGSRAGDATALFRFMREQLADGDVRVINFESPVSTNEATRHPYKTYSFASHPETLAALDAIGIDAISLGNNHCFDYLQQGMIDTLNHVSAAGIPYFGAGLDEPAAQAAVLQTTVNGIPLAFQGFNGIPPYNYPPGTESLWDPDLHDYNARGTIKGGAFALSASNLGDFLATHTSTSLAIPVLHGGWEYGEQPSSNMRDRFQQAVDAGAMLVKAHHPHTLYGIAIDDDDRSREPSLVFMSLGNFCFDQEVFETFNSAVAVVDVEADGSGGYRILRAGMRVFHQEDYVPNPTCGTLAARTARHLGHMSTFMESSTDGLRGAVVFPEAEGVAICLRDDEYRTSDSSAVVTVTTTNGLHIGRIDGASGATFLHQLDGLPAAGAQLGRDLLLYGDMEDHDVDADSWELSRWTWSDAHYLTHDRAHGGRTSLVLYRTSSNGVVAVTKSRNRITFNDGAQLTLYGHYLRDNAGLARIEVEYVERNTRNELGTATVAIIPAGSDSEWQTFAIDLNPPAIAGHLRVKLVHEPPPASYGSIYFDDLALIDWDGSTSDGATVPSPNNYTYLRLDAPGTVQATLRSYERRKEPAGITVQR